MVSLFDVIGILFQYPDKEKRNKLPIEYFLIKERQMSLNFQQFFEAVDEWNNMDERLKRLIGFNPATSNHYGVIRLYNQKIDNNTTDEMILEIRSDYVKWRQEILTIFTNNNYHLKKDEFDKLFSADPMFGKFAILNIPVIARDGIAPYVEAIKEYIQKQKRDLTSKLD